MSISRDTIPHLRRVSNENLSRQPVTLRSHQARRVLAGVTVPAQHVALRGFVTEPGQRAVPKVGRAEVGFSAVAAVKIQDLDVSLAARTGVRG